MACPCRSSVRTHSWLFSLRGHERTSWPPMRERTTHWLEAHQFSPTRVLLLDFPTPDWLILGARRLFRGPALQPVVLGLCSHFLSAGQLRMGLQCPGGADPLCSRHSCLPWFLYSRLRVLPSASCSRPLLSTQQAAPATQPRAGPALPSHTPLAVHSAFAGLFLLQFILSLFCS